MVVGKQQLDQFITTLSLLSGHMWGVLDFQRWLEYHPQHIA